MDVFRQTRRKSLQRRRYPKAVGILIICVIGGFLFIRFSPSRGQEQIAIPLPPPPVPTALDPNFLTQVNECLIPAAAVYGYTLRVTSGWRSLAEQDQIYEQGRTIDGHIVSEAPASKSIHNYGFAVDIADRQYGYGINWIKLGKIGTYCGLEQGPDGDLAHFEHRGGLTTADFAAGLRPPSLTLPCAMMDTLAKADKPLTLKILKNCGAPKF